MQLEIHEMNGKALFQTNLDNSNKNSSDYPPQL